MIDCDNSLPPIFVIQPHETEQLAAARCSVSWGRKRVDSASCRRENAVFPVRGNAAKLGTRRGCVESSALGRAHNASWGPRKVAKLCGERRGSRMNEFCRLRRNERYGACPDEVYKCVLVAKGLFSLSFPRLVFSKTPAPVHSSKQVGKRSARPRPSW